MTKPAKLYAQLLENPARTVSFRDLARLVVAFGFELDRTGGSHRQYVHPRVARPLPLQPTGKDGKRYQVRQFLDMVQEHDLGIDE